MRKYANTSGKSGVSAYEIGPDWIKVQFGPGGDIYKYSYATAGKHHVEEMKVRAKQGQELSTYISKYVKDRYEKM